jgi:hypothetical protein
MDKNVLLKQLTEFLDQAATGRVWGNIEFEVRDGNPVCVRTSFTNKLVTKDAYRAKEYAR